jgi:hypothetical protein
MRHLRSLAASPLVYPLLFAAYPVVFLWSQNRGSGAAMSSVLLVLGAMLLGALAMFGLCWMLLHDRVRAAIATTFIVILFATFGHVANILEIDAGSLNDTGLLIAWGLFAFTVVLLVRGVHRPERATRLLNLIASVLVGMNLVPLVPGLARSGTLPTARWNIEPVALDMHAIGPARDVYYLIFDRYAGSRTLADLYGFDNSAFLDTLRSNGFSVVDDALANYPQTTHSLASSLNMTYLDDLATQVGVDAEDWEPLNNSFPNPTVARIFRAIGYRFEHVGSWWPVTWADATADRNFIYGGVPEFEQVFLDSTLLPALSRQLGITSLDLDRQAYERVAFQVESLRRIAHEDGPTFTFAHFLLPHPPYVFREKGTFVTSDGARSLRNAYVEQLEYTNGLIESIVGELIAAPGPQPIIVLQSDEGPHPPEHDTGRIATVDWAEASDLELGRKLRILNAYYLPGLSDDPVYSQITPVNTFRMIFDAYYGGELPLLPDRTYVYRDADHPYRFEDVTDRLRS